MNLYQEQLIDNYKNPRNSGKPSWTPTHYATAKNISCGDIVTIFFLIEDNRIKEVSFEGEGCSICIGSTSLLTQEIKGKLIEEFEKLTIDDLLKIIGIPLTTSRIKCASIGLDAAKRAIQGNR